MKISPEISMFKLAFLELDTKLKNFGKTLCKFHKNRNKQTRHQVIECHHPAMGYGGINRNTDYELINCPRILYNDEGK